MEHKEFFTVKELVERWRVSPSTVYRWIEEGKINALKIFRCVRVPAREVARFETESEERAYE